MKTWFWLKEGWKAQSFAQMPLFLNSFISNHQGTSIHSLKTSGAVDYQDLSNFIEAGVY